MLDGSLVFGALSLNEIGRLLCLRSRVNQQARIGLVASNPRLEIGGGVASVFCSIPAMPQSMAAVITATNSSFEYDSEPKTAGLDSIGIGLLNWFIASDEAGA
jgi:hypothetical protein